MKISAPSLFIPEYDVLRWACRHSSWVPSKELIQDHVWGELDLLTLQGPVQVPQHMGKEHQPVKQGLCRSRRPIQAFSASRLSMCRK